MVGGYDSEDNVIIKMEDIRFAVNRHTANHMYELFSELNEYYTKEMEKINSLWEHLVYVRLMESIL